MGLDSLFPIWIPGPQKSSDNSPVSIRKRSEPDLRAGCGLPHRRLDGHGWQARNKGLGTRGSGPPPTPGERDQDRPPRESDCRCDWQTRDSTSCGRAVFDNVGSAVTGVARSAQAQHCLRGHPRAARRGEGTSKLRRSHRTRGSFTQPYVQCRPNPHRVGAQPSARPVAHPRSDARSGLFSRSGARTGCAPTGLGWRSSDQAPATVRGGRGASIQRPASSIGGGTDAPTK
jgi:hypothetical protein